ncbi:imelysin family protein [Uliginosibacterium sp. H1]|uniref:imelysin family protein n=1 Tax=Uliginosibacterium sp. H1 TaxID=3114757 RepID=UPI002E179E62|nr:imelysin family protein [Uliginosibacterium sp. H1]
MNDAKAGGAGRRHIAARAVRRVSLQAASLCLLLGVGGVAAQDVDNPAPVLNPNVWLERLAQDRLVPGSAKLNEELATLVTRLDTLCSARTPAALDDARAQWKRSALALRHISALPFGPLLEQRTFRQIDFWPTRPPQIDSTIARPPASMEAIGVTARGLPALEYLLFDKARTPLTRDERACTYAKGIATQAAKEAAALTPAWQPWRDTLASADGEAQDQIMADALNILIGATDGLLLKYMAKPAAGSKPAFDAWRSGESRAHLRAYYEGLRYGLQGGPTGSVFGTGLTGMLRGQGMLDLAKRIDDATAHGQRALDALPTDLSNAKGRAAVKQAANQIGKLKTLLAEDVADAMRVSVGFGETDGD